MPKPAAAFLIFTTLSLIATTDIYSQSYWVSLGKPDANVVALAVAPNGNIIAGTEQGFIFTSTDNGATWIRIDSTSSVLSSLIPGQGDTVFAATSIGIFVSTNDGMSWTQKGLSSTGANTMCEDSAGNLYAGAWNGVYLSTDHGSNWSSLAGTTGKRVFQIGVGPTGQIVALADSGYFLSSTDGGANWNSHYTPNPNFRFFRQMVVDEAIGKILIAGGDNGVWATTDNGADWTEMNTDSTLDIYSLTSNGYGDLFAGVDYYAGISRMLPRGSNNWVTIDSGFGQFDHIDALALDSRGNLFAAALGATGASVYRSGSSTLSPLIQGLRTGSFSVSSASLSGKINPKGSIATATFEYGPTSVYGDQIAAAQNPVLGDSLVNVSAAVTGLLPNTVYHFAVAATNAFGTTTSEDNVFETIPLAPALTSPPSAAINTQWTPTLSWDTASGNAAVTYHLEVSSDPTFDTIVVDDSLVAGISRQTTTLKSNTIYFWRVSAVNQSGEGAFSAVWYFKTRPQPPHAAALASVYEANIGAVKTTSLIFKSQGSYSTDGVIDSTYWLVNGSLISTQAQLTYPFGQGTNVVKLVVRDNFGDRDTSAATVTLSRFKYFLKGPVYAGPSLLGDDVLFVIGSGDAVYRVDTSGNEIYSPQVGGDVKSSSSIAYDTTIYIASSDKNLYAFSKFGTSQWPALPLGGVMTSTPAIDSLTNATYVGISNNNFFAVNRTTGKVAWNYFVDAPTVGCAVITLDRKLVFATVKGTIYGFDLDHLSSSPSPAWQLALSDSIYGSPAVDDSGNVYFGSASGKVYCIALPRSQPASIVWQAQIGGTITGSPVIDGYETIYIGASDGKLYAIDSHSGNIKWSYSTGSPIYSTATVSDVNMIYVGNHAGKVCALDTNSTLHWYYQDSSSVDAPLLYHNGTLYVGTTGGRLIAFYDDADSTLHSVQRSSRLKTVASTAPAPVWGTFQGNNQRTGLPVGQTVTGIRSWQIDLPKTFALYQNYPNPFNPTTMINYQLPTTSQVTLKIYDVLGREVATLVDGQQNAGAYRVEFNASRFASGVYLYRIVADGNDGRRFVSIKKLVLLK